MKKRIIPLGVALLSIIGLCSCNEGKQNSSSSKSTSSEIVSSQTSSYDPLDDDPIQLQKDPAKDYTYAESSNKDGSMNYEIFVRSFYDSNDDGIGDLRGVKEKLPYLADMGYKSLWLMPIFPSGSYHGYDVLDYYTVNSDFGTLDDFDALVAEADKYNIDIILDMVFNHCSINNSYFQESIADYKAGKTGDDSKADWFNYGSGGEHTYQGIKYESKFDASMPDFNLDSKGVRSEIENIIKFWIGHGVKGFRLDAVLYYYYMNVDKNVEFLDFLQDTAHKYDEDFYMVGEAWASDGAIYSYFKSKCDSFFSFSVASGGNANLINCLKGHGRCSNLASSIQNTESVRKKYNPNSYTSYFLSNHDQDRISKYFTDKDTDILDENTYKSACSFYSLLPGNSYTYYGEEIALKGTRKTNPDDQNDVRRRLPMIWSESNKKGECSFPDPANSQLADNDQVSKGAEDLKETPFSLLNHYKMMIHLRNKYSWIKEATFENIVSALNTEENSAMAYSLEFGENKIIVVHNFSNHNIEVDAPGTTILEEINVVHRLPELKNGKLRLAAHSSVILK